VLVVLDEVEELVELLVLEEVLVVEDEVLVVEEEVLVVEDDVLVVEDEVLVVLDDVLVVVVLVLVVVELDELVLVVEVKAEPRCVNPSFFPIDSISSYWPFCTRSRLPFPRTKREVLTCIWSNPSMG